jgi:hypothetical protein
MKRHGWIEAFLIPGLLLGGAALAGAKSEAKSADLSGKWHLNEDLTARLRESDRQEQPGGGHFRGGPPRGGGVGGPPGGGGPGGGGPGGGYHRREGGEGGFQGAMEALKDLTIEQTADTVTVTDAEGHQRVLHTDGRKVKDETFFGGTAQVRSSWSKDGSLVVEVKPDEGPPRTETYTVSNDRKLLYVTTEMEEGRRFRRAYDAVASPPS